MKTVIELLPFITSGYEVVVRSLPTKKNYSLLHGILKGLLFISGLLNNKKVSLNNK